MRGGHFVVKKQGQLSICEGLVYVVIKPYKDGTSCICMNRTSCTGLSEGIH